LILLEDAFDSEILSPSLLSFSTANRGGGVFDGMGSVEVFLMLGGEGNAGQQHCVTLFCATDPHRDD